MTTPIKTSSTIGYTLRSIRQIREHNGVKLDELAAELGITKDEVRDIDDQVPGVAVMIALQAIINRHDDTPVKLKPLRCLISRPYRPFQGVSMPVTRVTVFDDNTMDEVFQELVPCRRIDVGVPGEPSFHFAHEPNRVYLDALITKLKAKYPDLIVKDNAK